MVTSFPARGFLARMRPRENEKRTSWLFIKRRDAAARTGKKNKILDLDRSVASGRSMDEIAAGKGKGPSRFIMAKRGRSPAKSEWQSHRAAKTKRAAAARTSAVKRSKRAKSVARLPSLSRRSSVPRWNVRQLAKNGCMRSNLMATAFNAC
jgi:bifunctional non-homologous end joining protein LigD